MSILATSTASLYTPVLAGSSAASGLIKPAAAPLSATKTSHAALVTTALALSLATQPKPAEASLFRDPPAVIKPPKRSSAPLAATALIFSMAWFGCRFDQGASLDDAAIPDAATADARIIVDAAPPDASPLAAPTLSLPADGQLLAPTRAFLSWKDNPLMDAGLMGSYESCWTTLGISAIDDPSECPNSSVSSDRYRVIDPLSPNTNYLWKVRREGSSVDSEIWRFSTDNSVVGWWRFDEGAGMIAADSSGLGNTGTLQNGPVWSTGINGQALQFDGMSSQHVTVSNSAVFNFGTDPFTLSAWIYSESTGSTQAIVDKLTAGLISGFELSKIPDGSLSLWVSGHGVVASGGNVTNGVWHHVVATRSGTIASLYLDGALTATGMLDADVSSTAVLAMGCNSPDIGCAEPFHGNIDDVLMTNTASSAERIKGERCAALGQSGDILPIECL